MMKLDHIALWTQQLEVVRAFYANFFDGECSTKYCNPAKQYESYFVSFSGGARLELMQRIGIPDRKEPAGSEQVGFTHLAFDVGNHEQVKNLTLRIHQAGFQIVSQPRQTGDGYYESVVLDPDGNRVEITCLSPRTIYSNEPPVRDI